MFTFGLTFLICTIMVLSITIGGGYGARKSVKAPLMFLKVKTIMILNWFALSGGKVYIAHLQFVRRNQHSSVHWSLYFVQHGAGMLILVLRTKWNFSEASIHPQDDLYNSSTETLHKIHKVKVTLYNLLHICSTFYVLEILWWTYYWQKFTRLSLIN